MDVFAISLACSDIVLILPIYNAGEDEILGVNSDVLITKVNIAGGKARGIKNLDDLFEVLLQISTRGDVVLFMGAGNVTEMAHQMMKSSRERIIS